MHLLGLQTLENRSVSPGLDESDHFRVEILEVKALHKCTNAVQVKRVTDRLTEQDPKKDDQLENGAAGQKPR